MSQHWEEEFELAVSKMLLPHDSGGTALLRFLRHWALRWQIHDFDAMDTLQEAMKRGLVYIRKSKQPIHNPSAWLRGTGLNVLRDKVKEFDKNKCLVASFKALYEVSQCELPFNSGSNPLAELVLEEQLETLQKSIDALSADDNLLIRMHLFEEKTYAQIQKYFVDRDGQVIAEATLRQRESRALKRLGKIFLKLYNEGVDVAH